MKSIFRLRGKVVDYGADLDMHTEATLLPVYLSIYISYFICVPVIISTEVP